MTVVKETIYVVVALINVFTFRCTETVFFPLYFQFVELLIRFQKMHENFLKPASLKCFWIGGKLLLTSFHIKLEICFYSSILATQCMKKQNQTEARMIS